MTDHGLPRPLYNAFPWAPRGSSSQSLEDEALLSMDEVAPGAFVMITVLVVTIVICFVGFAATRRMIGTRWRWARGSHARGSCPTTVTRVSSVLPNWPTHEFKFEVRSSLSHTRAIPWSMPWCRSEVPDLRHL